MKPYLSTLLLVVGLYTAGALPQVFAPRWFLQRVTLGVETNDALTLLLARHWAGLATLVGSLLVYAAYHPEVRAPAMFIGCVEKLAFAGLIFFGSWKRTATATRLALIDAVMGVVLLLGLVGV